MAGSSYTMQEMRRLSLTLATSLLTLALLAPIAMANPHDGGEGTYGTTDDRVVTNAGFILIAFFPLFIFAMSMLQWRLDKRKNARKAASKSRAASPVWKGGW
jgi:hypothetical protein